MNHQIIHIEDGEADAFVAGGKASPSSARPAAGQTVILSFQADRRRYLGLEDASSPVEGFEPIGLLAVRLVSEWSLPRIRLLGSPRGNGDPSA